MKKAIYLILTLLVSSYQLYSQEYFGKYRETVELSSYLIEGKLYPQLSIEGQSRVKNRISLFGKISYNRNIVYDSWTKKGYFKKPFYGPSEQFALVYDIYKKNNFYSSIMFGAGGNLERLYFGPLIGFEINSDKFYLKAYAVYPLTCYFKENYSQDELNKVVDKRNIVYIRDFDPNSYFKLESAYKIRDKFFIGIFCERLYLNGFFLDFRLIEFENRRYNFLDLRLMSGINSFSARNCFGAELILHY